MRQHDGNLADSTSDVSTFGKAVLFHMCSLLLLLIPLGADEQINVMCITTSDGGAIKRTRAFFSFHAGVLVVHIHPRRFAQML